MFVARVFKAKRFARDARKAGITDADLCDVIAEVAKGQADDLGGGVLKKRLGGNDYRAIILTKSRDHWIYQYLYSKQDVKSIRKDELYGFRLLAESYMNVDQNKMRRLLSDGDLVEICNGGV